VVEEMKVFSTTRPLALADGRRGDLFGNCPAQALGRRLERQRVIDNYTGPGHEPMVRKTTGFWVSSWVWSAAGIKKNDQVI
jgi:hypothetical protein